MTEQEIQKELIKGVTDILGKKPGEVTAESTLVNLGLDSLGLVEIFVFIEKTFGLKLMEANLGSEDLKSIGTLAAYIHSETGSGVKES